MNGVQLPASQGDPDLVVWSALDHFSHTFAPPLARMGTTDDDSPVGAVNIASAARHATTIPLAGTDRRMDVVFLSRRRCIAGL
jgi:hypothetical protein